MQVGIRVVSNNTNLSFLRPVGYTSWSNTLATTTPQFGPAKKAVKECGMVISRDDWKKATIEAAKAKMEKINKQIAAAKAREEERKRVKKARHQAQEFDIETWQPTACSPERQKFVAPDDDFNSKGRYRGCSWRNAGRKPIKPRHWAMNQIGSIDPEKQGQKKEERKKK